MTGTFALLLAASVGFGGWQIAAPVRMPAPMTASNDAGAGAGSIHRQLEIPPLQSQSGERYSMHHAGSLPPVPPPVHQPGDSNTLEIPLPQSYRGCWRGVVSEIDSLLQISPPQIAEWVPKTYRICYVQSANGTFHPVVSETGMLVRDQVSNTRGQLKVISTDGRTAATMRAYLHFEESALDPFGTLEDQVFGEVDELTNMQCRIEGDVMRVEGWTYAEWNRQPWASITWHTDFVNIPQ
jgi:hypothetical protein